MGFTVWREWGGKASRAMWRGGVVMLGGPDGEHGSQRVCRFHADCVNQWHHGGGGGERGCMLGAATPSAALLQTFRVSRATLSTPCRTGHVLSSSILLLLCCAAIKLKVMSHTLPHFRFHTFPTPRAGHALPRGPCAGCCHVHGRDCWHALPLHR